MALPQDISPVNSELMDSLARSRDMDWIETTPGSAYMKIETLIQQFGDVLDSMQVLQMIEN